MKRGPQTALRGKNKKQKVDYQETFFEAARVGDVASLESLISEAKVDIDQPNEHGHTALMLAVLANQYLAVDKLLELGANQAILSPKEHTAFQLARLLKKQNAIKPFEEQAYSESSFSLLIDDVVQRILSFLPDYDFYGDNAKSSVCFAWSRQIEQHRSTRKPTTRQTILNSCATPEDTINILKDYILANHLNFEEYLQIISHRPHLAREILDIHDQGVIELPPPQMAILGQRDLTLALRVFADLQDTGEREAISLLGQNDLNILQQLLSNVNFISKISLSTLVAKNAAVAKYMFDNRDTFGFSQFNQRARGHFISFCGRTNRDVAEEVIASEELLRDLNGYHLAIMCQTHPTIAIVVLHDEKFKSKWDGHSLAVLGHELAEIAQFIMADTELLALLQGENLAYMAEEHVAIAEIIYGSDLNERLTMEDLIHLGRHHASIAKRIVADAETFEEITSEEFSHLCEHLEIAEIALNSMALLTLLGIKGINKIRKLHPSLAYQFPVIAAQFLGYCQPQITRPASDNLSALVYMGGTVLFNVISDQRMTKEEKTSKIIHSFVEEYVEDLTHRPQPGS